MPVWRAEVRNRAGRLLTAVDLARLRDRHGCGTVAIHRGRLHEILARHVGGNTIEPGRRCIGIDLKGGAPSILRFADGSEGPADVVIGAGGLHALALVAGDCRSWETPRMP